jgi:hypothetical protein
MAENGNTIYLTDPSAFPTKAEAVSILRTCSPEGYRPREGVIVVAMADAKRRNGLHLPDKCRLTPDCGTVAASGVDEVPVGARVGMWFDGGGFTQYESKAGTVRIYGATAVGKENPWHRGVVLDLDSRMGFSDWVLLEREREKSKLAVAGKPEYTDSARQGANRVLFSRDRAEALDFWGGDAWGLSEDFLLVLSEQILAVYA